jgi:hypothetical protein
VPFVLLSRAQHAAADTARAVNDGGAEQADSEPDPTA